MNTRTIVVTRVESGQTIAAVLRSRLSLSWSAARRCLAARRVQLGGAVCVDAARRVLLGQKVQIQEDGKSSSTERAKPPFISRRSKTSKIQKIEKGREFRAPRKSETAWQPIIRFADDQVVVVEKPAGLTTMRHASETAEFGARAKRFLPITLADLLPKLLADDSSRGKPVVIAVHRLDRDTSGLVVFALTAEAEQHLGRQFRAHTVGRRYLAVVRGRANPGRIESILIANRGDGRRGSVNPPGAGKRAVTHVKVLEHLGEFTLVECRLDTGRTHQVRIHLGERGTPLCGERIYDRPLRGQPYPDTSSSPRLALHAASLSFRHPASGKELSWEAPLPDDLAELLARLRKQSSKPSHDPRSEDRHDSR